MEKGSKNEASVVLSSDPFVHLSRRYVCLFDTTCVYASFVLSMLLILSLVF